MFALPIYAYHDLSSLDLSEEVFFELWVEVVEAFFEVEDAFSEVDFKDFAQPRRFFVDFLAKCCRGLCGSRRVGSIGRPSIGRALGAFGCRVGFGRLWLALTERRPSSKVAVGSGNTRGRVEARGKTIVGLARLKVTFYIVSGSIELAAHYIINVGAPSTLIVNGRPASSDAETVVLKEYVPFT